MLAHKLCINFDNLGVSTPSDDMKSGSGPVKPKGHLVIAELGYPGLLTSILHLGMNPLHTVIRTG